MSKRAEEAALKAYDEEWPASLRLAYQEGYEQAEKDLALTWEDMKMIDCIFHAIATENTIGRMQLKTFKEYYSEALRLFNEKRKEK